jgi:hypothetical protein
MGADAKFLTPYTSSIGIETNSRLPALSLPACPLTLPFADKLTQGRMILLMKF